MLNKKELSTLETMTMMKRYDEAKRLKEESQKEVSFYFDDILNEYTDLVRIETKLKLMQK